MSNQALFHLRTLWLFTKSDFKTVIFPQTVFGIVVALSGPLLTSNPAPKTCEVLRNLPKTILWLWLNLLNEVVSNQRLPGSIVEDSVNKPWRPLPTQRMTSNTARKLLLCAIPTIYIASLLLGGTEASMKLMVFSHMYNELDGANENWLIRNVLNACGLSCFSVGAAVTATGFGDYTLQREVYVWISLLAVVIATTVQIQDLPDIEGDRRRNRKTMPLVYGHVATRWSVSITIMFWSIFCCTYWDLDSVCYLPCMLIGISIAVRTLVMQTQDADEGTWKLWCLWMMILYSLPLMRTTPRHL
ncbi:unnamed protein product [Periconia digitata]|uniref:UbiA prenyltransferase n=1 Tax=Periconia digitata TaxID=1303443 RepID=A0A9W4UIN6_9PLEO|nr:unnamed protein product [Periconia digitata]